MHIVTFFTTTFSDFYPTCYLIYSLVLESWQQYVIKHNQSLLVLAQPLHSISLAFPALFFSQLLLLNFVLLFQYLLCRPFFPSCYGILNLQPLHSALINYAAPLFTHLLLHQPLYVSLASKMLQLPLCLLYLFTCLFLSAAPFYFTQHYYLYY